ncbi:MAG: phosphoserine phosphatase SerB [Alphaproteobacteria bacterium]
MNHVATLIGNPERAPLESTHIEAAAAALRAQGAAVEAPDWLGEREACDVPFTGLPSDAALAALRRSLRDNPIDIAIQPVSGRRKAILVADMDSTMITSESLDELAVHAGVGDEVKAITARSMNGEIDFREALKVRVAMLKGLPTSALEDVARGIVPTAGAATLIATMRASGAYTVLVTGGFSYFSTRVCRQLGFDRGVANVLEIVDGQLTGRLVEPVLTRDGKRQTLLDIAAERRVSLDATLAVGDGANDLEMIRTAGMGVAFRAKPVVASVARTRVDHGDLTALLFFQGYRRREFRNAA